VIQIEPARFDEMVERALDGLPEAAAAEALWWERHVVEVLRGLPPDAPPGAVPRPEYDPGLVSLTRREQAKAAELAALDGGFSLLCGRYEGVDQRVADHLVDGELSVGDVVLSGGEVAALMVLEAVARLVPGVLGNAESAEDESFADGLLEYPQYTRPASFRGWAVPEVLVSGDHGRVARWRRVQALRRTLERRPDLIAARGGLREDEIALLAQANERELAARPDADASPRDRVAEEHAPPT